MSSVLTPTQLRALCEEYGLRPSKGYGQHYLINEAPIMAMLKAADVSSDDTIVEVGPGFGILTLTVAPLVKRVFAFEIEQKLRPYWEEQISKHPNIEMIWGNALQELTAYSLPLTAYKVLANLPYHITSDVLRVLLELDPGPEKIVVMVQKEVAERMCAKPGDMSVLSVAVQYYGESRIVTQVSHGSFWPVPKVDSAVVSISLHKEKQSKEVAEEFFHVVRSGFAQKRKQLWHNLANGLHLEGDVIKQILREVTGNERIRAEEVSVEEWKKIVSLIHHPS